MAISTLHGVELSLDFPKRRDSAQEALRQVPLALEEVFAHHATDRKARPLADDAQAHATRPTIVEMTDHAESARSDVHMAGPQRRVPARAAISVGGRAESPAQDEVAMQSDLSMW